MQKSDLNEWLRKNKKPLVIIAGIVILNLIFGFDARFTLINLLWLLV
jgi:hypothetical protein